MKTNVILTTVALALAAPIAFAQSSGDALKSTNQPSSREAAPMSDGEVKKIDKDAGKITIKHGPLANLDMPGMTMVFRVKDPTMLDSVKQGDKVKFRAEKAGGALTVTNIETVR